VSRSARRPAVILAMLCLALTGSGQTPKPAGRISGHVYRADSHTPLAQATITLQVADKVVASVETAADGGYSFDNLSAEYYYLVAWKTGFVGRRYGVSRPRGGATNVHVMPGSPVDGIDFSLPPEPAIAQMPDAALTDAHPDLRQNLGFENGRFSPDGSQFAFGLTNIRSGGPDEIWLYDLRNQRLRRVSALPGPYVWSRDGKLYASFVPEPDRKRYLVATRDSISEIDPLPAGIEAALVKGPYREEARHAAEYAVTAENTGHGALRLFFRLPGSPRPHVIAAASWELETFLLNPARRQVIYPETNWFGSIVTYDLRTGQSETVDFQSGENLRLLDLTGDGTFVAYSVFGACRQEESTYQRLIHVRQGHAPASVCFIHPK
jgi:hypothetical protein